MNKSKTNRVLGLVATLGALVAHSGDALASGTCTADFVGGTTEIACATSLSESATGFATQQGNFSIVSVTYINGQDGARGFLLDPNGNIRCTGPLILRRGLTVTTGPTDCTSPPGLFRIVVN
jgi:hypothetical protein